MKTNMKTILLAMILVSLASCGSSDKEETAEEKKESRIKERVHEGIQREYVVRDSNSDRRPGWIEEPQYFAKERYGDADQYRYFAYETDPKLNRDVACKQAAAQARADIASEITSFIDQSLASAQEGNNSINENDPQMQSLREYVETELVEKVQAVIYGSQVVQKYWERRQYQEDLGAAQDYKAFTCAVLVKMESRELAKLVRRAANYTTESVNDPEMKAKVQNALKDSEAKFDELRAGRL